MELQVNKNNSIEKPEKKPSEFTVIFKEFRKDKLAMGSFIFLGLIVIAVYITSFIMGIIDFSLI